MTLANRGPKPAGHIRLAIISTHPIQYYAPWYRNIARIQDLELKVFYLWDFGVTKQDDPGFDQSIQWDIPLLDGYDHAFIANVSRRPGTSHPRGLRNPGLVSEVGGYRPDVVLLMGYNFESLYRFLWEWGKRTPILLRGDSHRLVHIRSATEIFRRALISLLFKRFSGFLYVGKANRHYYQYHGVPEFKLFFAPHAVDNERFASSLPESERSGRNWRRSLSIQDDRTVVLFAGKFEEKKRPHDLLTAFIQARANNSTLLFVGAGKLEGTLRHAAAGLQDVVFAPFQNQTQMPGVYAAADVLVLPSYGPSETWGLAINEAMCLGRPIIASTHVGCAQDLVRSGRNGLVFPAGDVRALTDALREALADKGRLKNWGKESAEIVTAYTYQHATEGLLTALSKLVPHWITTAQ
jgi:glycosyltransferase involved in cell wall biosynthesis